MAHKKKSKKKKVAAISIRDVCFVIMPFGGWLDDYYQEIYCPAIDEAGLTPHRADDLFRPSTIVNDIWAYTKKARLVLADLSGKNPNVFYELGLAHALAKPAILVAESMDDVPFDLRALRVLVYDKNAPDWGGILKAKVRAAIVEVMKSPAESVLPTFLETSGTSPKPTVTAHEKEILEIKQQIDLLREEVSTANGARRESRRSDIAPDEARALIYRYVEEDMPDSLIVRRVSPLGPPRSWIMRTIRDIRLERRKKRVSKSDR